MIGVLFDIDALGGGLYGYAAYHTFFAAVDTRQLAGCTLSDGDTNATLYQDTRQYCISVTSADSSQIAAVKSALSRSTARGLLPLAERFLDESALQHEPLVPSARIGAGGELVYYSPGWVLEAWRKSHEPLQMAGSNPAESSQLASASPDPATLSPIQAEVQPITSVDAVTPAAPQATAVERPGCVTAYAVLSALAGIFVVGLSLATVGEMDSAASWLVSLASGALALIVAPGLWRMRNWARLLVITLQGLGIVVTLLTACQTLQYGAEPVVFVVALVQLIVSGSILWWFAENGYLFD
jgi:hypothetical protein